ncbi:MAG TPA: hypothetical protein VNL16_10720 [Chloroflexota bacterium]|nr:hypothetical protein [Chloroflexota bacterium]
MSYVTRFVYFWYDFVVGDDWTVAAGVIVALVIAAVLARSPVPIWWWMPLAVVLLLSASIWRVARASKSQ